MAAAMAAACCGLEEETMMGEQKAPGACPRCGGGHGRGERAAGALLPAAVRQEQAQVLLRALPPQPRRALHPRLALAPLPSPIQPCHLAIELARLAN